MRPYVHDPKLFRDHFIGQGLPAFKGRRVQRGYGVFTSKLKRYAVPLLMAGVRAAAPHMSNAASRIASSAMQSVFPNNAAMQQLASSVAGNVTNRVLSHAAKKLPKNPKIDKIAGHVASHIALGAKGKAQKKRKHSSQLSRKTKKKKTTSTRNIFA